MKRRLTTSSKELGANFDEGEAAVILLVREDTGDKVLPA